MFTSKYLSQFQRAIESGKVPTLLGTRLIVEMLPKEELKKGSILIATNPDDYRSTTEELRAQLALVLMVGEGGYDAEAGAEIQLPYKPGNIVLISDGSLRYYTQFPGLMNFVNKEIALTRSDSVHLKWESVEAYEEYKAALNKQ